MKQLWQNLSAKGRQGAVFAVLISLGIIIGTGIYYLKFGSSARTPAPEPVAKREIKIDSHLYEKSAYLEGRKAMANVAKDIDDIKKQFAELKTGMPETAAPSGLKEQAGRKNAKKEASPPAFSASKAEPVPLPPRPSAAPQPIIPPPPGSMTGRKDAASGVNSKDQDVTGGIEIASNRSIDLKTRETEKKSKKTYVYLPPSFMAATMLSGLDAPTMTGGKGEPAPVLLRVKDLAFLPNRVRANLKGCFVISEGHGSLADERAHLRITNLSCLSKKGTAVIDQKIKGFVVDSDGKIGLRGEVVSKMGSLIARSLIAGFIGGVGEAVRIQTQELSVSPLGSTQTVDPGKIGQAGLGQGLYNASKDIQKFYLDLAKETLPVIEVGAVRDVTLVVSEGSELEIRELHSGEALK
ncbi:MAG TPA: TraB/VirB10 family protein [Syntrophales bacterium]|nr:TraB/VirB10 family protein [Syntrophales bacterium]